jgi:hypothetical protein
MWLSNSKKYAMDGFLDERARSGIVHEVVGYGTLLYWKNRLRDTFLFGRLGKYIGPIVTLITQVFCTSPSNMPSRQATTNHAVIEKPNLTKRIFYQRNQETQYASRCP